MSDRTVRVRYEAEVNSFIANVQKMQATQDGFTKSAQSTAQSHTAAMNQIGQGMVVAGGIVGAFAVGAVAKFADFDQAMSHTQAATGATGDSLSGLRDLAIKMGADTQFSATEAAQGITEMAKAGVSTADIMGGGLKGALDLAAAGQLGVGRAGEIAATAMNQFGLSGSQVSHVADLLAAGAGKAQGSVEDLALGLTYVGPVAAGMGISIEQTTGVLAEFASAGLVGEKGGTALRGVLLSLTAPSDSASQKMQELGIHLYDAQGKFIGVDGAAQQLHDRLSPLDEATRNAALGQIFGNAQLAGAQVLYQGGAKAVQDWTGKVNDSGFAARQAAALTDNLKGDLERLGGAFDTVLIQSGSAANGGLRGLVQTVEHGVQAFGNLSPAIQTTVLAVSGVGGGALVAVGGFVLLAVKVAETAKAFKELELASRLVSLTPIGLALTGVAVAAGFFIKSQMDAQAAADAFADTLDKQTGALTDATRALAVNNLMSSGALQTATSMGISAKTFTDAVLGQADAVKSVNDSLDAYSQTLGNSNDDTTAQLADITAVRAALHGESDALGRAREETKLKREAMAAAGVTDQSAAEQAYKVAQGAATAAQEQQKQAAAAQAITKANQDLIASLNTLANLTLGARGAEREYEAAVDAATEAIKANGKTLDDNTDKGRANNAALDALSRTTLDSVVATFKARDANQSLGDAVKVAEGQVSAGREAFVNAATSMGLNRDAAARLADQLGLTTQNVDRLSKTVDAVPDAKTTKVTADTAQAQADVAKTSAAIRATPDHQAQVRVDNAQARAAVIEASTAIRGTPDHQSQIRADNAVARAVVAANNQMIRAIPDHQSQIRADNAVARSVVSATNGMINAIPDHQSQIRADNAVALAAVRTASGAINAIPNHTSSIFANLPVLGSVAIANAAILGVPNKTAQVNADPSGARAGAAAAQGAINGVTGKTVTITTNHVDNYSGNYANKPAPAATGGPVVGPGTGTSDTAGLWALSNGEHILTAAEVNAAGGHGAVMRLRKALLSGAVQYAATGGPAERSYSSSVTYHQVDQTNRATVQRTAPLINIEKILAADVDAGLRAANTRLQDYVAAYGIGG